ncbi:MAG: hypothetical protein HY822_11300 [Acidobacteria bacterium]|nr:hypothetical protein [Acidobacteriota bacterium]
MNERKRMSVCRGPTGVALLAILWAPLRTLAQPAPGQFLYHEMPPANGYVGRGCGVPAVTGDLTKSKTTLDLSVTCAEGTFKTKIDLDYPAALPSLESEVYRFSSPAPVSFSSEGTLTLKNTGTSSAWGGSWQVYAYEQDPGTCRKSFQGNLPNVSGKIEGCQTIVMANQKDKQGKEVWSDTVEISVSAGALSLTLSINTFYQPSERVWAGPGDPKDQKPGQAAQRPETATDVHFVAGTGGKLDGACTFRSAGPIEFDIDVTRFVAPTNGVGMLSDREKLIENRVVSPKAKLRIAAFDADSRFVSSEETKREVDSVYLNDSFLGTLEGVSGAWSVTEFEAPIERIRFPEMGEDGAPPTPAKNWVRIDVDQSNSGNVWCTAVDWADITIRAAAPLILVHGTNAQSNTWEYKAVNYTSPVEWLPERGIAFEHRLNMEANGAFATSAAMLTRFLQKQAQQWGVQNFHLIAHSKGASDTRYYLNRWYRHGQPFKILSLCSLGTPSQGTILSDLAVAIRRHSAYLDDNAGPLLDSALFDDRNANHLGENLALAPVDPALEIQRIDPMGKFNENTPKRAEVPYYSIAGDADANGAGVVGAAEAAGVIDAPSPAPQTAIRSVFGQRTCQALGRIRRILALQNGIWPMWTFTVSGEVVQTPEPNDLVSTVESVHCARCGFEPILYADPKTGASRRAFPFNHTQLKSPVVLQVIRDRIQRRFPVIEEGGK